MRNWKTEIHTVGGEAGEDAFSTCYKTYNLVRARQVINKIRKRDNTPKRKVAPVSVYILEELIETYFKDYAQEGAVLEKIIIKDSKHEGL